MNKSWRQCVSRKNTKSMRVSEDILFHILISLWASSFVWDGERQWEKMSLHGKSGNLSSTPYLTSHITFKFKPISACQKYYCVESCLFWLLRLLTKYQVPSAFSADSNSSWKFTFSIPCSPKLLRRSWNIQFYLPLIFAKLHYAVERCNNKKSWEFFSLQLVSFYPCLWDKAFAKSLSAEPPKYLFQQTIDCYFLLFS